LIYFSEKKNSLLARKYLLNIAILLLEDQQLTLQEAFNVQISVDRTTETGATLLHFAEKKFNSYANEEEANILFPIRCTDT